MKERGGTGLPVVYARHGRLGETFLINPPLNLYAKLLYPEADPECKPMPYKLTVNGRATTVDVPADSPFYGCSAIR